MSEKILIVDDQAVMLRLIAHPLEGAGYQIATAMTGVEALQKIQSEQPDLIILDVMLPDASGIDICRRVRQVLHLTDLPIIILSGQTELSAKIQGLEAGADDYVTKPVDPKEMLARVRAMLARTQRLRQVVVTPTGQKPRQGRVVAVIGAKGGVGVTTMVANLATGLAMRNQSTIAVELRPYYGTLARHLGLKPTATLTDLLELLPKNITDAQISSRLQPSYQGLRVLLGPQRLKDYREAQVEQIEMMLNTLTQMAEFVVVDLPHMPSLANRSVLRMAHTVLVLLEPESSSVAAAQSLIELLRAWAISPAVIKAVVVNRIQAAQTLGVAEIGNMLGVDLLGTVIAATDQAVAAINIGSPMIISAGGSIVASTYLEIVGRVAALRPVAAR
jgi:DNA-binding response OmpR family regulator